MENGNDILLNKEAICGPTRFDFCKKEALYMKKWKNLDLGVTSECVGSGFN